MELKKWFIKHMKGEPPNKTKQKQRVQWTIDESKCLSVREVNKIRAFCRQKKVVALQKNKFSQVRNWFMVELGLNSGLRVSEMASLKHSNLLLECDRSSIKLVGKGNKPRTVWINAEFKKTCEAYFRYKQKFSYNTDEDSYLLNNLKGNQISKRSLQKFFKKIIEKAGLPEQYHIHCLRHTYATFLLKVSNYNYKFVKEQLGHCSIKITETYASVLESEGKKAVEKLLCIKN